MSCMQPVFYSSVFEGYAVRMMPSTRDISNEGYAVRMMPLTFVSVPNVPPRRACNLLFIQVSYDASGFSFCTKRAPMSCIQSVSDSSVFENHAVRVMRSP